MKEEEKAFLKEQLKNSAGYLREFFIFHQNTRIQLMSNQLQYFQSLGGIALAILTILLGSKSIDISVWWAFAWLTALILVIYVSTHVRELNDSHDKGLQNEEKSLNKLHQENEEIIKKAFESNDSSVWKSHILEKKESNNTPYQSYAGEIATFLFLLTIFFGFQGFFYGNICFFPILPTILITLIGIILCFVGAMKDWNLKLTALVSAKLDHLFKK